MAFVTVLGVLPLVMADDNYINDDVTISVTDSGYPTSIAPFQWWFVPGDPVELTLDAYTLGQDTVEDKYDIIIFPAGETLWSERVKIFDDVPVDEDGNGAETISGDTTEDMKDGNYDAYVGPIDWIQNDGFDGAGPNSDYDGAGFRIQMYKIMAETDSRGYIPGDEVTVFYSVISIKDGSLITEEAFSGLSFDEREWGVWSFDGETHKVNQDLDESSGSFSFKIANAGSAVDPYSIGIFINATFGDERKSEYWLGANPGSFAVSDLALNVFADRAVYQIDSVVIVTVQTSVLGVWPPVPEPDVSVEILIMEDIGTDATEIDGYGGTFKSDASGMVVYAFSVLAGDFEEDKTYTVRANVEKWLKEDTMDDTFDVEAGGRAISVNMAFDKEVYTTGDTVVLTIGAAVPAGGNTDLTYLVSVTDDQGGTRAQEVMNTNTFQYDIPNNFEGTLTFDVEVINADADSGTDSEDKEVHYAVILVNAEPEQYEAGDTIEATFELITTLVAPAGFFYRVRDSSMGIVLEGEIGGTADSGSFSYVVPDVPSRYYTFYVYANLMYEEQAIWVTSNDRCYLISGYDVEISVDAPTYNPGDRVTIHYDIKPKSDEGFPDKFLFSYGMSNGPQYTWQSDSPSGDIFYKIPDGVNQGDILIMVSVADGDFNGIGSAMETLHIQEGASALEWTRALDVPLFSWILLLLIILLIIFMLFRRPAAPERAPAEAPAEPAPVEEEVAPVAPEDASPLAINCKSCGAEIEITTSKRPIEVMCPSCGETEMVE
jgi:hypothetical protein